MIRLLPILCFFLLSYRSGQAQIDSLRFPVNLKLTEKFKKAIRRQTNEYDRLFYQDSAITKHYPVSLMLDKIDNDSNYEFIFLAEYWIAFHYWQIIPELIKRIVNKKEIGLVNTMDLIIWERLESKQMKFYGHGGVSNDDLFTVAGRANRLLTEISGEKFGQVSMYSTQKELEELQMKWIDWLRSL
jgi:hypothetical protein